MPHRKTTLAGCILFFSDDFEIWNHQWASAFDGIRNWSNSELKARTTQCILRMRVTASNFRMQRTASRAWHRPATNQQSLEEEWRKETDRAITQSDEQYIIWNSRLRPVAIALKEELQRRIYGEPPYPTESRMLAIDHGMLSGVDAIGESAVGLESLVRQLA